MAYQRQTDDILAGSLNLLAPGDLVPKEDAIALHNFRVDAAGAIKTRRGTAGLYVGVVGAIHSLFRRDQYRYIGSGTDLYRVTGGGAPANISAGSFAASPISFAAGWGTAFFMQRAYKGRDDGTTFFPTWLPAAPGAPTLTTPAAAGGGLVIGQNYKYYVTWVTASGEETDPGEANLTITVAGDQVMRVSRPATADARVTHWNVYREGNTLDNIYRVNRVPYTYATTYLDDYGQADTSDLELTRFGVALAEDNDAPPDCAGLVGPYYDTLIAFSSAAHPNWYWWSKPNQPASWPGASLDEGNHAPVGEDGEELLAAVMHGQTIRFYKERTIWRLNGNPDPDEGGILTQTNPEIGLIGRRAIATEGDLDYIQGRRGIYVSNGDFVRKVSPKLDPLFWGDSVAIGGEVIKALHPDISYRQAAQIEISNGLLYFSYANVLSVSATPNQTLVLDLATGRWASDSRGFRALYYEGDYGEFVAAPSNFPTGGVMYLETGDRRNEGTTGSAHFQLAYQTGYRNQGVRDRQKTYSDVVIQHTTGRSLGDRNLTVKAYLDAGKTQKSLGSIPVATFSAVGDAWTRSVFQIDNEKGVIARDCAIRVEGECEYDVTIASVELHYYLEARDALSFDSDETDCGDPRVKEFSLLQLDIDAPGAYTWTVMTDMPGSAMASRATAAAVATSGRRMVEIPLTTALPTGRLVRVLLTTLPATPFRLYGARLKYRPIGTYRDGAAGEIFETRPIAA